MQLVTSGARSLGPARYPGNHEHDAHLVDFDREVARLIDAELERQQTTLEMIASENFAPVAALEAQGSVLTNK